MLETAGGMTAEAQVDTRPADAMHLDRSEAIGHRAGSKKDDRDRGCKERDRDSLATRTGGCGVQGHRDGHGPLLWRWRRVRGR
jgi:hypothetical protein